jgi:hypothetical protein
VISTLLAWSEYRLPYDKDIDGRYQGRREYLVFSLLLMVKYTKKYNLSKTLSSISGKMIIKGHKLGHTKISAQPINMLSSAPNSHVHESLQAGFRFLLGIARGEIDKMRRMEDGETSESVRIQRECPSLLASIKIDMSNNALIDEIFRLCDPTFKQVDH